MTDHKLIYMLVLTFFNLVDFNLHAQLQLFLQILHFRFVLFDQFLLLIFEKLFKLNILFLQSIFLQFNVTNIATIKLVVFGLEFFLQFLVCILSVFVVCNLLFFESVAFNFGLLAATLILIFKMLNFLRVRCNISAMFFLGLLHFCVIIADFCF